MSLANFWDEQARLDFPIWLLANFNTEIRPSWYRPEYIINLPDPEQSIRDLALEHSPSVENLLSKARELIKGFESADLVLSLTEALDDSVVAQPKDNVLAKPSGQFGLELAWVPLLVVVLLLAYALYLCLEALAPVFLSVWDSILQTINQSVEPSDRCAATRSWRH
ncbi:MAG: hypothetical protein IPJ88_07265 [Myxococcales bacterium]|nr:MAG: hypothetical protein IPJ88_07265 [Myxococcales bacterium]